jgi:hypothetical protein
VTVNSPEEAARLGERLGVAQPRPAVALIGGAASMSDAQVDALTELLAQALVPVMQAVRGIVVDGGTDCGVARAVGRARQTAGGDFPLVGVVPEAAAREASPSGGWQFEPHHTHVVRVPGQRWGDEAPWLSLVASSLAAGGPSLTLVANGGTVTYKDVRESLKAQRQVIVLSGSGRTADDLSRGVLGHEDATADAQAIACSPLMRLHRVDDSAGLLRLLRDRLILS